MTWLFTVLFFAPLQSVLLTVGHLYDATLFSGFTKESDLLESLTLYRFLDRKLFTLPVRVKRTPHTVIKLSEFTRIYAAWGATVACHTCASDMSML